MKIDGNYILRDDLNEKGMETGFARLSWHGRGKRGDHMSPRLEYRDDLGRMWVITGYNLKSIFNQFHELGLNALADGVKILKSDVRTSERTLRQVANRLGLKPVFNKWNKWGNC